MGIKNVKQQSQSRYTDIIINGVCTEISFSDKGRYVKVGTEILPEDQINKLSSGLSEDGTYIKEFICLNDVLFMNNKESAEYLINNNPDLVKDLVVLFNYEHSIDMMTTAIIFKISV